MTDTAQTQTEQAQIDKSILPSIQECEKFVKFLNSKLDLRLNLNDLTILIHETTPNIKGFFRSKENLTAWCLNDNEKKQEINSIVLSSHTLQETPYETLTHELAHYINHNNGIKDCSGKYHNKKFKAQAEKLLLQVEKAKTYGFAVTSETDAFKEILKEFKPSQNAFKLFQNIAIAERKKGRLLKFACGCGCIIRTAKNEDKPLNAICQYCNTQFQEVMA